MLARVLIAGVLLAAACLFAWRAERTKRARLAPAYRSYDYPRQIDRADFERPDAPWLVVVFSSASCLGCQPLVAKAAVLSSEAVAVAECEFSVARDLHARYAIEGVPTTIVADHDGVVRKGFIGAVSATDLWAAVADLRNPPAEPRVCGSHAADPASVTPTADRHARHL
jgi:hypothetical protein